MIITDEKTDIQRVLFSEEQIRSRVNEIGLELTMRFTGKNPIVVCVLKGASFFYVDLCRQMKCNVFMDFIAVSSYGESSKSSGVVRIIKDLGKNITDRDLILVEDIIDSGLTLKYLTELFEARKPASITTVCLLDKYERRQCDMHVDYCGFKIPDCFVVGYGLDYSDYYRNLPYIGVLDSKVYED